MTLPAVPDTFSWTSSPSGLVLKCLPLEAIAPHVFTTRELALSSTADWLRAAETVEAARVVTTNQVHGRDVYVVRCGALTPAAGPAADALVSDDPTTAIAVRTADCVPLLLADRRTGAAAAVHAGWRGTAAGAARAAVDALAREFGASPADLVAAIGPSIGVCCYEVGSDVVDAFAAAGHLREHVDRWFVARPRLRLDLAGANRDQLVLAGVPEAQIHLSGLCTAMHLNLLTSYRAEKEKAGRIAGVIRARAG